MRSTPPSSDPHLDRGPLLIVARAPVPPSSASTACMGQNDAVSEHQQIVVDVRDRPLSVDEALAAVTHPRAGAVAVFVGTVREHDDDREGVTRLSYSAHPDAGRGLSRIAASVAAEDQIHGVYAVHRVGDLAVGDLAVVCAVSAEHRAEAFAAARRLVEELKAQVPIWKRQEFAEGEHQWVGL